MGDPVVGAVAEESQPKCDDQTPLLIMDEAQNPQKQEQQQQQRLSIGDGQGHSGDKLLDRALERLDSLLTLMGYNQRSVLSFVISWFAFLGIGLSLPVVVLLLSDCPNCERYQIKAFELVIVVSQASLATISLLCLSYKLRKYGIRKFLFVDRSNGHMDPFRDKYIQKISDSVRLLVSWILPCFFLKLIREVFRVAYVHHDSWWHSVAILLVLVVSWTYVNLIFLSACILFHLVCNFQIIHIEDYGKLLETGVDVSVLIEEHVQLRYYLSKISHRFRIYLVLVFLFVTASQFATLFQTTEYQGIITLINGGDFAISSIIQVCGIVLCLNAAAKISHRAQAVASIASQWHAAVTCNPTDPSQIRSPSSLGALSTSNSESDLESLDFILVHKSMHLASNVSSYFKRQSFVMYLQSNPSGITIFGWTVDRGLINTIFCLELTLVLFVLGKTVIVTTAE